MTLGYDHQFYADLEGTALPSARRVVPLLLEWMPVKSVVDVGCGDGSWLSVFREHGIERVLGLDGPWVDLTQLKIPADCFRRCRVDQPLALAQRFDLAITLEVAEHLPPERATAFVAELCALAPVVLFSAAVPDQGGRHHANEQWPAYWVARFAGLGYRAIDAIRPRIWEDAEVCWWYRQNCLLFVSVEALAERPKLATLSRSTPAQVPSLIHPELFQQVVERSRPSLKKWLREGPAAWARWREKRRRRRERI